MPPHQSFKGGFVPTLDESGQELSIRQAAAIPDQGGAAELVDHWA
jgi:hypothetical protein